MRGFVTVESDFDPDLGAYYHERLARYLDEAALKKQRDGCKLSVSCVEPPARCSARARWAGPWRFAQLPISIVLTGRRLAGMGPNSPE